MVRAMKNEIYKVLHNEHENSICIRGKIMSKIGKIKPLRFYSEKVLPLVYDNSLSYYEVLNKVTNKLNDLIEAFNTEIVDTIKEVVSNYFVDTFYNRSTETITFVFKEDEDE